MVEGYVTILVGTIDTDLLVGVRSCAAAEKVAV